MTSLWALRVLSRCLTALNLIRRSDGTLNRTVTDMVEWMASATTKVTDGVSSVDVVVGSATGVWVRIFVPTSQETSMPVVVYYHGGGFVFMKPDFVLYDRFCRRLVKKCRAVVVSVHYRRAPEHKFPAAYDDSHAVLNWLNSEKSEKHLPASADLSRVFLAGDSAGGNIVHHVGIQASLKKKNLDRLTIRGLILIQPFFGGEERTPFELQEKHPLIVWQDLLDWFWKAFLPLGATRDHAASHVFGADSEDISRVVVPPVILFVGGRDLLQDWQMRYAEDMKRAGKNVQVLFYDDGVHLMGHLDQIGVAEHMLIDIASFLSSQQDRSSSRPASLPNETRHASKRSLMVM